MERVKRILGSAFFQDCMNKNRQAEKDRQFCRHDMAHALDVARLAQLLNIREDYGIEEELVYAAALLHDMGRWKQYEDGTGHEQAGTELAPRVLEEAGFSVQEREAVTAAIASHRNPEVRDKRNLQGLLYRADKLSRPCFACDMEKACNWKKDKKNMQLIM
jgi:putative nucleotidyltransferase with HDIG domain